MKITVLNPNSSRDVTAAMAACLAPEAAQWRARLDFCELPDAPRGIETDAHHETAAPMVADFVTRSDADAVVVACFSDPGLAAARRAARIPVVGIGEAAYVQALLLAPRFGVISLGPASVARHRRQIADLGLTSRLAGDRAAGLTVAESHAPDAAPRLRAAGRDLVTGDGAGVVILGCAGMGNHRAALCDALRVPVIDPVMAGVAAAAAILEAGHGPQGWQRD